MTSPEPGEAGAPDVHVASLRLTDFRNYASLSADLASGPVVLTGPNGAGKTNLLEAISFLSPGRGLRRAALDTVARRGGSGAWAVAATVARPAGAVSIGTGLAMTASGPERRRSIRIDRGPTRAADALLDYLNVIWLTPAMDGLFTGAAGDRRRFVDRAVLAIDRQHGRRVNAFEKAVRGRNRLLAEPSYDRAFAEALETEIAELGVAIAAARREWCDLIAGLIAEEADAPFPRAGLALDGFLEQGLMEAPAGTLEADYRTRLGQERPRDAAAGRTLTGPHRSDLAVRHAARDVDAALCSTGEQKALLVGLVLAQARLIERLSGSAPVVLLDEIAAHLDAARRATLFARLAALGCQTVMTGTEIAVFDALASAAQRFEIDDAVLTSVPHAPDR